jgi:hypothetical protein
MYHAVIGTMLSESVKGDEAIAELQQARELDPKLADNLLDKGKSLLDEAPHIVSANLADADTQDACWLISIARKLASTDAPGPISHLGV